MTGTGRTIPADYFRELYRTDSDPWDFATSAYEHAKYEATLAALPRARYDSALELGCANGVFTAMLAAHCDAVLAVDVSPDALATARERCAHLPHVSFNCVDLGTSFPSGVFDVVTFCELGFYFAEEDLMRIELGIARSLQRGGTLALVHWTPPVDGHAMSADDVHEFFIDSPAFAHERGARTDRYRLDVFHRR
ncbi:MAG: SAM-dependent methyltransferase [Candidatus Velthaea sp.]